MDYSKPRWSQLALYLGTRMSNLGELSEEDNAYFGFLDEYTDEDVADFVAQYKQACTDAERGSSQALAELVAFWVEQANKPLPPVEYSGAPCPACGTATGHAPGIGPFCPNLACDRIDNLPELV